MHHLEELDNAAQRSMAAEAESAVESRMADAAYGIDDAGRARILDMRQSAQILRAY